MNRWNEWARQLRFRHGRKELRFSEASFVFFRRASALRLLPFHHAATIHLAITTPITITLRPFTPRLETFENRWKESSPDRRSRPYFGQALVRSSFRNQEYPKPLAQEYSSHSKFAHANTLEAVVPHYGERRVLSLRELVTSWSRKPAVSQFATELPLRLRQLRTRTERKPADLPPLTASVRRRTTETPAADPPKPAVTPSLPLQRPLDQSSWTVSTTAAGTNGNAVNVEALTSQVLQQIDRRLIVYRERMGRV